MLRDRLGHRVEDLLWWDGERLLGFLGIYAFGAPSVELTGMVDPGARRRGIASALLEASLPLCRDHGYSPTLLVTPRASTAGRELALARGAVMEHSEHALQLRGAPVEAGFGWHRPEPVEEADAERTRLDHAGTLIVELDDAVVGTERLTWDQDTAGVYGFVVHPDHQGRGIGREILRRVCRQARADGASRVHLEVTVDNDRALNLYASLGFTRVATEDYYALPT